MLTSLLRPAAGRAALRTQLPLAMRAQHFGSKVQLQPPLFKREIIKEHSRPMMRKWHLFDATDQVVGRLAVRIAILLQGKHQPDWNKSHDTGDTIVVVNCEKIQFTGKKWKQKIYRKHSGYPGGLKTLTATQVKERDPARILLLAVKGMLPSNLTRDNRLSRLKVYEGPEHPHRAQFKLDVRKQIWDDTIVIPILPDPAHQKMVEYWRGMGDDGLLQVPKGTKIRFEFEDKIAEEEERKLKEMEDKKKLE